MQRLLAFLVALFSYCFLYSQSLSYDEVVNLQITQDRTNSEWAMQQDYVIMISIDGFRYDYAEKYHAVNILNLAEQGAKTERLISSFPSKTFPNHYTLVTGLLPSTHGLVGNEFYSREKDYWYKIHDKQAVQDSSWYGGKPLWLLAEEHQMLSANFFWVGSEAPIGGKLSTYSYAYNSRIANEHRIRRVLDWLAMPELKRPHMIMAYFSLVDDAGHRYGPDHEQTKEAVLKIDGLIGELMSGLDELSLPVNVVLVSDHGMAEISRGIVLPDVVDLQDAQVSYSFPPMIYQPDLFKKEQLYRDLLEVDNLQVYKKEEIPEYLRFSNDDRIGDIVLMTDAPTVVLAKPMRVSGGTHGFDPYTHKDMGAIFYAEGPGVIPGMHLPPVENIHVYPFVASLLGLTITQPIDGNKHALEVILREKSDF